jgi:AcrR family transcriptional regulator
LRERKKQRTRATLIDAAAELCLRQGYEHTTVDQIAAIADVSPRTFSRYFATKDAIALALIDEVIANAAIELSRQPTDIGHFEALRRSYVAMYYGTKTAPPGGLSSERIMCIVRIILSSAALRHAATEYRRTAVNIELAKRMGVDLDDRKLKLVASIWASLTITALGDLGEDTDWQRVGIDDIVSRMEAAFAEFIELVDDVRQPV